MEQEKLCGFTKSIHTHIWFGLYKKGFLTQKKATEAADLLTKPIYKHFQTLIEVMECNIDSERKNADNNSRVLKKYMNKYYHYKWAIENITRQKSKSTAARRLQTIALSALEEETSN